MYLKFYGLKEEPFHITPDPEFLYLSPSHKEALALMVDGVEQRKGFIVLTGEVGVGKTIIVHAFLQRCQQQQIQTIYILNSRVTFGVLMNMIYESLGLERRSEDVADLVQAFNQFLVEEQGQERNVVLVIDEAQNMSINALEDLGMLSSLETSQGRLLPILLIGQQELKVKLNLRELRNIQKQIGVRIKIAEMTPAESLSYIVHRLVKAGMQDKETSIFTQAALRLIVKQAQGIPRKINIICDNTLTSGFNCARKPIPEKVVKEVIADLDGKPARVSMKWVVTCASLAFLILVIAALVIIRIMDFSKTTNSNRSTSFTAGHIGDRDRPPVSSVSSAVLPDQDAPVSQPVPVSSPVPDSPAAPVAPSAESLSFQERAVDGREPTVSPGIVPLPDQGPGAAQALSAGSGQALSSRDSLPEAVSAPLPLSTKTVSGKIAGPADHSAQKGEKPKRGGESAPTPASKPGAASEADPHDPNKLMDWFLNHRAR